MVTANAHANPVRRVDVLRHGKSPRLHACPQLPKLAAVPRPETMQLLDIGANLGYESFHHDLDAVLQRAHTHGVSRMIVTGASREDCTSDNWIGTEVGSCRCYAGNMRKLMRPR